MIAHCVTELRSGPPGPGQKFSTYYIEIIKDWYQMPNDNLQSRCKIKAVPSNGQGYGQGDVQGDGQGDVQYSVDDTIHLDIITVGSKKKVRKDRPEKI